MSKTENRRSVETPPHNETATSVAAAHAIKPKSSTLRSTILEFVRGHGSRGATAFEVQESLNLSGDTVRPRMWELRGMGLGDRPVLLEDSGRTRPSPSGRQAVVYVAVER